MGEDNVTWQNHMFHGYFGGNTGLHGAMQEVWSR
jgi:hypothetical protein